MNLRTTKTGMQVRTRTGLPKRRKSSSGTLHFGTLFKFILPFAVIFMLAGAMNALNSETERLNRQADKIKRDIHRLDRVIADRRLAKEQLCGRAILNQIAYFRLKLHYPAPGQIRPLESVRKGRYSRIESTEPILLSQR